MNEQSRRDALIDGCRWLADSGFTPGTSGNLSVRTPGGTAGSFLVTPAGVPWERIDAGSLVPVDGAAGPAPDTSPSSEWRLHAAIYHTRPDAGAIVHAHPRAATALACLRRPIPAFHYMVAQVGGAEIPCAPYATFGTQSLAESVADTLAGRHHACLMANHGMVALGADLDAALAMARAVEDLAWQYLTALAAGDPILLEGTEIARVVKQFAVYADHPVGKPLLTVESSGPVEQSRPEPIRKAPAAGRADDAAGSRSSGAHASLWEEPPAATSRDAVLVLLAHGSLDPDWKGDLLDVAERLGREQRRPVRVAFLQFDRPDLPTLAQELRREGIDRIALIPVFYAAGKHLREDVPALVRQVEEEGTSVELLDAPGELDEFGDVLVDLLGRIAAT
jgi:L-fuculose-phosphate aldolase